MYTLIRNVKVREGLQTGLPSAVLSMAIAELFYKFHSFTLECVAFLATWLAASWVLARGRELWLARRRATA